MNNEQTMTNEEAIRILEVDKAYLYPDECYNTKAYNLAIEALKMNMDVDFDKVREQFKEADDDLCKTCRYGDDCEFSCKIFSGCRTTRCYKYEGAEE